LRKGLQIAVVGDDEKNHLEKEKLALAEEIGAEIAKRGHVMLCGGRGGVMSNQESRMRDKHVLW
jgi:uncharacterized protein (TIGR00725 family)